MRRTIVQTVIAGAAAGVLYLVCLAAQIAYGMYMTATYVPDIVDAYESVEGLRSKVSFGWSPAGVFAGAWKAAAAGALLFLALKLAYGKLKRRGGKEG